METFFRVRDHGHSPASRRFARLSISDHDQWLVMVRRLLPRGGDAMKGPFTFYPQGPYSNRSKFIRGSKRKCRPLLPAKNTNFKSK